MPNLDRTGPEGKGSKTGRGMGKCRRDSNSEGPQNSGMGRGLGRGRGHGRGFGWKHNQE